MTIVVSVKVTDGVVLASDSATTFFDKDGVAVKVYNNANKVFNLIKGCPVGAMTYGAGSVGTSSIATLSKDLRLQLANPDSEYYLDRSAGYSLADVANKVRSFFTNKMRESYPEGNDSYFMGYRVLGYSSEGTLPEGYEISVEGGGAGDPVEIYSPGAFGPRWAGENEAIDRLIFGYGSQLLPAMREAGLEPEKETVVMDHLNSKLNRLLFLAAMPIQDAIDLARFLAETAAKFSHFSMNAATIGGPIEIATITKHEGFKWVARKHFFNRDLNHA